MKSKSIYVLAALAIATAAVLLSTGCETLRARDNLNKGVQAFKSAKYPEAVERFKEAVQLDPTFNTARLYLATAYMSQYIPGAQSPENLQMSRAAKENFLIVLKTNPRDTVALASMASLNYNEAQGIPDMQQKFEKLDEAKGWYEKLAAADPKNKEAFYSLGVIAWAKWYPAFIGARSKAGMKPEDPPPLKDKKARDELRAKYWGTIDDGIKNLEHALDLDHQYDDAMAYLNLLHRERADLGDTPEAVKKDIEEADNWLQKALDVRKQKTGVAPAAAESGS